MIMLWPAKMLLLSTLWSQTTTVFIGHGVFTTKQFVKGAFLLEYDGDLIKNYKHACRLEKEYEQAGLGSYMYFFKYQEKKLW